VRMLIFSSENIPDSAIEVIQDLLHLSFCFGVEPVCVLNGLLRVSCYCCCIMKSPHFLKTLLALRTSKKLNWRILPRPISRENPFGSTLTGSKIVSDVGRAQDIPIATHVKLGRHHTSLVW